MIEDKEMDEAIDTLVLLAIAKAKGDEATVVGLPSSGLARSILLTRVRTGVDLLPDVLKSLRQHVKTLEKAKADKKAKAN